MYQMIADLSMLAVARNFPLWLHWRFHTSSVWISRIAVVTLGNVSLSHDGWSYRVRRSVSWAAQCDSTGNVLIADQQTAAGHS